MAGLRKSLETFGPLDIVFNTKTKQIISGHQRLAVLKEAGATEVVRENGWAYIAHPKTGEKFPVRFVDWDKVRQRLANLVAQRRAQWLLGRIDELFLEGGAPSPTL